MKTENLREQIKLVIPLTFVASSIVKLESENTSVEQQVQIILSIPEQFSFYSEYKNLLNSILK